MSRHLNDLKWFVDSPELLALSRRLSTQEMVARMSVKGSFEFKETHRLGVYFEQLWQHLTSHCDSINVVTHNLQVIIDKHTYGEFDSILFDKELGLNIHCELAVKFYLQVGSGDKMSDWVGPNLRDRFDNKNQRLFDHQLTLSENPVIRQWLKQQNIQVDDKKVLTRGRLFYPFDHFMNDEFSHPKEVNPQHLKGFWTTWEEFAHLQLSTGIQWYLLPKMYWLSEVKGEGIAQLEPLDTKAFLILGHTEKYSFQRIQQVVGVRGEEEVMRGFVVTDDWLRKAKERVRKPS